LKVKEQKKKDEKITAGIFGEWLKAFRESLTGGAEMDVPCGACRGCCTSSLFVHIEKKESKTIAHIDKKLLYDVPGMGGNVKLLGYNKRGVCPMLLENECSIYDYRPQACRLFDCRIYTAAGVKPDYIAGSEITRRVKQWQFEYAGKEDENEHKAVRKAAEFIQKNAGFFPNKSIPEKPDALAVLALKVYKVFLDYVRTDPDKLNDEEKQGLADKTVAEFREFEKRIN